MKTISVIVPAYKSARWLPEMLTSARFQNLPAGWEMELLVGVDGCKETLAALKRYGAMKGLRSYSSSKNIGVDVMRNSLVGLSTGDLIAFFDSDDVMYPDFLRGYIEAWEADPTLEEIDYWVQEASEDGTPTGDPWRQRNYAVLVCYARAAWARLGGFKTWRVGADTEIRERSNALGFKHMTIPRVESIYRRHPDSLMGTENNWAMRNKNIKELEDLIQEWKTTLPIPVKPAMAKLTKVNLGIDQVHVSLCSIPCRREALAATVASILPQLGDSDRMHVFLNGYEDVPEYLADPRIDVERSQDHGDYGDANKFFWTDRIKGYCVFVDDDVIYPPMFIDRLLGWLKRWDNRIVAGFHGEIIRSDSVVGEKTVQGIRQIIAALSNQYDPHWVHGIGTGSMAYHSDLVQFDREMCPVPNMCDTWFAAWCQRHQVPILIVPHLGNDFVAFDKGHMAGGVALWESSIHNDGSQMDTGGGMIEAILALQPWTLYWIDGLGEQHATINGPREKWLHTRHVVRRPQEAQQAHLSKQAIKPTEKPVAKPAAITSDVLPRPAAVHDQSIGEPLSRHTLHGRVHGFSWRKL